MDNEGTGMPVSQLPPDCIEKIGKMLSTKIGSNYKNLATMLGFNHQEVEEFEVQERSNPGRVLLATWSHQEGATVTVLKSYLEMLQRADILKVLDRALQDNVYLVVVVKTTAGKIVRRIVITTSGSVKTEDAIRLDATIAATIPTLQYKSIQPLDENASSYKGREIQLIIPDKSSNEEKNVNLVNRDLELCMDFKKPPTDTARPTSEVETDVKVVSGMTQRQLSDTYNVDFSQYINVMPGATGRRTPNEELVPIHQFIPSNERIPGFHAEANSTDKIKELMNPHLDDEGAYIVRPRRNNPDEITLSVIENHQIVSYQISRREDGRYCLFNGGPAFDSVHRLLSHYRLKSEYQDTRQSLLKLSFPIQ